MQPEIQITFYIRRNTVYKQLIYLSAWYTNLLIYKNY